MSLKGKGRRENGPSEAEAKLPISFLSSLFWLWTNWLQLGRSSQGWRGKKKKKEMEENLLTRLLAGISLHDQSKKYIQRHKEMRSYREKGGKRERQNLIIFSLFPNFLFSFSRTLSPSRSDVSWTEQQQQQMRPHNSGQRKERTYHTWKQE